MVEDTAKLIFIIFFIYIAIGFRGPIKNPFWEYFKLADSRLNKLVSLFRFVFDWGVFTGCSEQFVDVQITANYSDRNEIWYMLKDKNIGGFKMYSKSARICAAFYYWRHEFMSKSILESAQKLGDLESLKIELIYGESLDDDGYKNKKMSTTYFSWRKNKQ